MGKSPQKDREAAADLVKRGYPHGRRFTKGLTNIPNLNDVGSAAYRRRMAKTGDNRR